MSAIYAIVPAAHQATINAVGEALSRGQWFTSALTNDPSPSPSSVKTHFHMYDALAKAQDYADYAAAKAGLALPPDINGDPVAWGEDGNPSTADAFAAFGSFQLWANDSDREPADFAAEQRAGFPGGPLTVWSPI